jgi:riboflavin kinase/FMN adenylyltransferase
LKVYTCESLKLPASVIAIGAFDGVHIGHQKLILNALRQAENLQVPLVVYTFDPPPRVFFQHVHLLTPLPEKLNRLRQLGVQNVIVAPFDSQYASQGAECFLKELQELSPVGIWVGGDFRFGADRTGSVDTLKKHFPVHVLEPVKCKSGEVISSSRIRQLLKDNIPSEAYQLLGWDTEKAGTFYKENLIL